MPPSPQTAKARTDAQGIIVPNYRTLSIHVETLQQEQRKASGRQPVDPAVAIRQIDVHLLPPNDVLTRFSTSLTNGLESAAVQRRSKNGKNVISPPRTRYGMKIANYVFGGFNFLMWIAFIVTLLSYQPFGGLNGGTPAVFNLGVAMLLLLVIILSSTFYAVVDWHASRIMKSIKNLVAEETTVIRDGQRKVIPAPDVVVGDIVVLSMGDRVPADLRLVEVSNDLKFDRSLLTGESEMIAGTVEETSQNALETRNLAFSSTFVTQGACTGVVFAIGDKSVMGRIVAMSGESKFELTTVQREVWIFTKIVSVVAVSLFCLAMLIWGIWIRKRFPNFATPSVAIINAIGCLTACVPQGLPVCVALSLTIIAKRMARRHVLVKNLATIETLGCMSILCSDKTGTLTEGKMSLKNVAFFDYNYQVDELLSKPSQGPRGKPAALKDLHMIACLCNGAYFDNAAGNSSLPVQERPVKGDATDTAVLRFSEIFSLSGVCIDSAVLHASYEKLFEIPFNSRNKWMLTVVRGGKATGLSDPLMLVKGAPDVLFPSCKYVMKADGTTVPFDDKARSIVMTLRDYWGEDGQRVLALCQRRLDGVKIDLETMSANEVEELMYAEMQDLVLVGLVGIRDPPRYDVKDAIAVVRRAGVRVFMVTGDFKLTAVAIAKQVGIISQEKIDTIAELRSSIVAGRHGYVNASRSSIKPTDDDPIRALVLTGEDITAFTPADWDMVASYTEIVFARTTPEQKLIIVEELKARGNNIVAVTGDGVNDAPAMKAADIGVAMGSGSDVAKEAASMILLNNDLSSIPVAIEMGRLVFDNLKKVIIYAMPLGTYTELMAVFTNVFLGMQIPLSSYLQVCFCITNDVVMSISLMYEESESDLMLRKPRNARKERLTNWRFFVQIYFFIGLMTWPSCMGMWFLYMSQQGFGFYDVLLVYDKWVDGYKGFTIDQLNHFVSQGQCIYYITMVFIQYGCLLAVRNRRISILDSNPLWGPRRNLAVPLCMIGTALIAVTNLYGPGLQHVFLTAPIPAMFWGLPFGFALGVLIMDEIRKLIVRSYPNSLIAKWAW